ncbi:MAG: hypothetical protein LWW77_10615 [Propionibacteriales bacterium]|nr:hypothetical protein [Propionibacteriales bacterium]
MARRPVVAHGPIPSREILEAAGLERIEGQIRWELQEVLSQGYTQEKLGIEVLGYTTASQLNKIVNGSASLTVDRARMLDEHGLTPVLGGSFEELALMRATRQRRRAPNSSGLWDVFLALPMASTDDDAAFSQIQHEARALVQALQERCDFTVYCGALQVAGRDDFDSPAFALADNIEALRKSSNFLLWVDRPLTKPSSVWVEAGIALALGKPCVYLVKEPETLPYILRQAADAKVGALGSVRCEWVGSSSSPANLVRRHGRHLFSM